MKKLFSVLLVVALVGCATTSNWQDIGGKLLASTALTVDAAMKGWAFHVVNDNPPQQQQDAVKQAYGKYQIAMTTAQGAYVAAVTAKDQTLFSQASSALTAASSGLTQLISSFNPQPTK